ncbi:MAG: hypothetical protein QQN63_08075 [Nitrosopumilus sp.]
MHVFVRFSKCNMKCDIEAGPLSPGGFVCDTEFDSGTRMTLPEIDYECRVVMENRNASPDHPCKFLLLTGGEPALQYDIEFYTFMKAQNWALAIETNGSIELPLRQSISGEAITAYNEATNEMARVIALQVVLGAYACDWICVSPKVAEHGIKQRWAHEVKYVRAHGQALLTKSAVRAMYYLISPTVDSLTVEHEPMLQNSHLSWCIKLVSENPQWRLSVQQHKFWRVR